MWIGIDNGQTNTTLLAHALIWQLLTIRLNICIQIHITSKNPIWIVWFNIFYLHINWWNTTCKQWEYLTICYVMFWGNLKNHCQIISLMRHESCQMTVTLCCSKQMFEIVHGPGIMLNCNCSLTFLSPHLSPEPEIQSRFWDNMIIWNLTKWTSLRSRAATSSSSKTCWFDQNLCHHIVY